jgi:hypothetical protein
MRVGESDWFQERRVRRISHQLDRHAVLAARLESFARVKLQLKHERWAVVSYLDVHKRPFVSDSAGWRY